MQRVFNFLQPNEIIEYEHTRFNYRVFPDDSLFFTGVLKPGLVEHVPELSVLGAQLSQIVSQGVHARYIWIDGGFDPVRLSIEQIESLLAFVNSFFPDSKVILLSSRCEHHFINHSNIIYFPYCFFNDYQASIPRPRSQRIGCLNRNNTPHRAWLMHNLLSQGLIDPQRDVYSIAFASIYDGVSYSSVAGWLGTELCEKYQFDQTIINNYPPSIATHPDEFINDYTTHHPAWHTAIAVITETEPGDYTMVTEKTLKAIMSQCCWTAYMSDAGYRVLEDFGFEPRLFDQHASGTDIKPIMDICRTLDTESVAMDYHHSRRREIAHNFAWFGGSQGSTVELGPWVHRYLPKVQAVL